MEEKKSNKPETRIKECGKCPWGHKNQKMLYTTFWYKLQNHNYPSTYTKKFQPNYRKSAQGNQPRFPEDVAGPHRKIIKKHHEKLSDKTMGHMRMGRQGMQSTK